MIAKLPGFIRVWRPDVIFCAGNSYTIVAVAMRLLLGRRCPPIVAKISNDLARGDFPAPVRFFYHRWCRIQARYLDHIVGLSLEMRAEIITTMLAEPFRVSVVNDPILGSAHRTELAEAGASAEQTRSVGRRFIAVGRLARQKDFALLIRAFNMGADRGDRLVIVGEGPERPHLERLIRKNALGDRVRLVGHSSRIARWIAQSDILILSSRYEGLPAVVVEALAAGLGIVATDCCASIAGLLDNGRFGTLVQPCSLRALAVAIALAEPGQKDRLAAARLAATFDARLAAAAYLAVFGKVIPAPIVSRPMPALDRRAA